MSASSQKPPYAVPHAGWGGRVAEKNLYLPDSAFYAIFKAYSTAFGFRSITLNNVFAA